MQQRINAAQIMTTSEMARKHYKEQEEIYMRQKGLLMTKPDKQN